MINYKKAFDFKKFINEYKIDKKIFDKNVAKNKLLANLFVKNHIPAKIRWYFKNKKDKSIEEFLSRKYENIIKKYKEKDKTIEKGQYSKIIWMCWWQGEENMPPIVKKCVQSVKKNAIGHEIIIINKENYREYLNLPDEIYKKVEKKLITLTHLSDLIRMNLLSQYGGIWIDATIYLTKNITTKFIDRNLNTLKISDTKNNMNISRGRWCGYFIGGTSNHFFQFANELLVQYNKDYDLLIDFFLIDYVIDIAYNNLNSCRKMIDDANLEMNHIYLLINKFNEKYIEKTYNEILNSSEVFKLSFKRQFKLETEKREETIYKHFIN